MQCGMPAPFQGRAEGLASIARTCARVAPEGDSMELLDLSDPRTFDRGFPHEFFRRLRRERPVAWHEGDVYGGPGYWIVSKYEDVKHVSKNPRLFSSVPGNQIEDLPQEELLGPPSMIGMDPPAHARYR